MRLIFSAYSLYLTVLLLSPNPQNWIGVRDNIPDLIKMLLPFAHLVCFSVLSVLAFAACWPLPKWGILLSLAVYGAATEIIQAIMPYRRPEWSDLLQDLGGATIGFIFFLLLLLLVRTLRRNHVVQSHSSS